MAAMKNKEQEIEEMAEVLRRSCENECFKNKEGFVDCEACEACVLYEAGYRKQSEGEWIERTEGKNKAWFCSECQTLGSPQWKCCPVCEAKMKGGAE